MQRHEVESTVIDAIGYSRVLELRFESGRVYQYYNVPEEVYNAMLTAASKGKYFNEHIRGKYSYQEIELKVRPRQTVIPVDPDAPISNDPEKETR
jgi:N-formylglutamate amidohydrolase